MNKMQEFVIDCYGNRVRRRYGNIEISKELFDAYCGIIRCMIQLAYLERM